LKMSSSMGVATKRQKFTCKTFRHSCLKWGRASPCSNQGD